MENLLTAEKKDSIINLFPNEHDEIKLIDRYQIAIAKQLNEDGFLKGFPYQDDVEYDCQLTYKGFMLKEAGGFVAIEKDEKKKKRAARLWNAFFVLVGVIATEIIHIAISLLSSLLSNTTGE
ncbi:hypothetical protein Barb6_00399 [Bacteroidales bacterium Barb6]|nr:hypothetical protein Barb6_00399 [Bacteroidales bacterium Barb6]